MILYFPVSVIVIYLTYFHCREGIVVDLCFGFVFSLYLVFVGYSLILISDQFVLPLLVVCVANAAIYFKLKVSDVDVDH